MQTQQDFSKQLIKGKIAEMIFDQMFRREKKFTVIPFGYEAIIPELMQYADKAKRRELIDNVRSAPDFALVTHSPEAVVLVEVKYRSRVDMVGIREHAEEICDRWKLVWLFVATPEGFYFDSCNELLRKNELSPLSDAVIPTVIQKEYLQLLREFIHNGNA